MSYYFYAFTLADIPGVKVNTEDWFDPDSPGYEKLCNHLGFEGKQGVQLKDVSKHGDYYRPRDFDFGCKGKYHVGDAGCFLPVESMLEQIENLHRSEQLSCTEQFEAYLKIGKPVILMAV